MTALHWEQTAPATPQEKKLYGISHAYSGNTNGDTFAGPKNLLWACRNPKCTNRNDCKWEKGLFRFLKYPEKDCCPYCGSKDIYDYELETFQTQGELLAKSPLTGDYKFLSWKDQPVTINHDDKRRIGIIEDVWIDPPNKAVVELISIDRQGPHNNESLCRKIEAGLVDSGSMELMTGLGWCSVCAHIHYSEDEFCDHLKHEKGLIDPKTGLHVFECCRNIQGCGHSIIATGEPADSGALVRQVFAADKSTTDKDSESKEKVYRPEHASGDWIISEPSTNLNPSKDAPMPNTEGKPDFSDRKAAVTRKPNLERIGRSAEAAHSFGGSSPMPSMNDMAEQLKVFGNYDGTRTKKDIRMASMTPAERQEFEEFESFKAAKRSGTSMTISAKPTFRPDAAWVVSALRRAVATKKVTAKELAATVAGLTLDKADFVSALSSRKMASNTISRLKVRKAALTGADDMEEMVFDVLADSLIEAGEALKQQISDVSYEDVANEAGSLADDSEGFEKKLDEEEPTILHTDEDKTDLADNKNQENEESKAPSDSLETKPMNDTKHEAQTKIKPEEFPTDAPTHKPEKAPAQHAIKPEEFPLAEHKTNPGGMDCGTLKIALNKRLAAIEESLAAGTGDTDALVTEHTKVTAQLKKISPEKTPGSEQDTKNLGGNGLDENPKAVATAPEQRKISPEKTPGSEQQTTDLGGNGLDENAKAIRERIKASKDAQAALTRIKASITNPTAVSAKDIAMLKEMGILPKDFKAGQALPKATDIEPEEFPNEAADAHEGLSKKKGEFTEQDKADIEKKNEETKTGIGASESKEAGDLNWDKPSQDGVAIDKEKKELGWDKPTPVGESTSAEAKEKGWDDKTTPGAAIKPADEKKGDTNPSEVGKAVEKEPEELGWKGGQLKLEDMTAEYIEPADPGKIADSAWTVSAQGKPLLRVALRHAFPTEVVAEQPRFASEEYGNVLMSAIADIGAVQVHKAEFGGRSKLFTSSERKAQANPTPATTGQPTGAPAQVDPAVSDKILNEAKPGISVLDLLSTLAAPVIAESDSLSVSTFMEELVNIAQAQDKVTELTTKLNANVQNIKTQAGLPAESTTAETPEAPAQSQMAAVAPAAPAPTPSEPNPQVVQAMKPERANEERYALFLRAGRIEPIAQEEQNCGLIPNATYFHSHEGGSLSRKAASHKAKEVLQERVAELMKLDENAYLITEKAIRTACRKVKAQLQEQANPELVKRKARWAQMQVEAGGKPIVEGIDGVATVAESETRTANRVPMKFKIAGGVDQAKHQAALEARENRNPRKED